MTAQRYLAALTRIVLQRLKTLRSHSQVMNRGNWASMTQYVAKLKLNRHVIRGFDRRHLFHAYL
jgi:inorganic triphosphatase YgiF